MPKDHRSLKSLELGDEPPLVLGDDDPSRYSRRGISLRWLFGAVVTAVTSTALMGGALFAALDGRYVISAAAAPLVSPADVEPRVLARKGDRIRPTDEPVSSRRVIDVSTVVRQGDERIIAKKPYVLVNASLVLDRKEIGEVPKFNLKDLIETETKASDDAPDAITNQQVDGEIKVSVTDFPLESGVAFENDLDLDDADVTRQVQDEVSDELPDEYAEVASAPEADTPYAVDGDDFFVPRSIPSAPNIVLIPENVSALAKSSAEEGDDEDGNDLLELVQPGDTLSKILIGSGVSSSDVEAIDKVLSDAGVGTLTTGQTLHVIFEIVDDDHRRPMRLSIYSGETHVATVATTDSGTFVLGEAPSGPAPNVADLQVAAPKDRTPTLYESLYQTAVNQNLPDRVRDILVATFANEVDFNAPVRPGEKLTVMHSEVASEADGPAELLFAALTVSGTEQRFYRFKSDDGTVDYYDPDGRTGDRFLLRKPVARGVLTSTFGPRRHPIYHRVRMHNGVDYGAPRGTQIYAAADGVVSQAGWTSGGYGRHVTVDHRYGYQTVYGHQSRIADGIKPGVKVKQGQVIGYVGSTGYSTGPHLHYEIRINGRAVNPLKIRLRRGKELSGEQLVAFGAERDRIDDLLSDQHVAIARR
ncbi:M23 family metallopeptidase [Acuticoccus sediminis]|uniref:M23 family metallopeptidase n=1 Tax=Acuticoccus sediminis TaxID=2184697 RepID=UPI001CFDA970|nr:M23 family metallopeptidase [Acuticoccus sediminis]